MKLKSLIILCLTGVVLSAVNSYPTYVEAVASNNSKFTDISTNNAYFSIIHNMRDQDIINGYQDGSFKPNQYITRQHAAALIGRVKALENTKPYVEFNDVSGSNPYYEDIVNFQQAGILEADSLGNFYPNKPLTRGEMAKVLAVTFNLESTKNLPFTDVPSSHEAYNYVRALYSSGITTGDNGLFKPKDPLTRAHYAVFLNRALKISGQTPAVAIVKQLEQSAIANEDIYEDLKPFHRGSFSENPISVKMFLEGSKAVRANNMKFTTAYNSEYDSYIFLTSEGYKTPIERWGNSKIEFSFSGYGENEASMFYDFRSDKANQLAKDWLQLAFPQLAPSLMKDIDKKVMEAREGLKSEYWFPGNIEYLKVDDYTICLGVDSFFEGMSIYIDID